ncbi:unnamed protein product [Prorocentrum cordatum]|uniref:Uncharacterized protein n=1 Tax=Prorocentrum cordatum TaxID=2364126 RepID=A0ABN9UCF6_9DINO|nr:unnamed protein product [Polarella glacialis]
MERRRYNREEEGRGTGSGEKRERRGSAAAAEGGGRPREHGSLPRRERGTSRPEDERCEQPVADTADGRSRPEGLSASSSVVTPLVRARGRGEGRSREGKAGGGKKADRRRELALSRAHQLTGRRARLRWGASGRPWIKRGASRGARARAALARPSFQGGNSSGGDPQAPGWVRPVLGLSRRCGRRRRGSRTRPRRCLETATTAALACSPSRGSGERARALPRRVSAGSAAAGAPARRRPWLPPSRPARPPEPTRQCADPGAGP